jgi:hypothetical protein
MTNGTGTLVGLRFRTTEPLKTDSGAEYDSGLVACHLHEHELDAYRIIFYRHGSHVDSCRLVFPREFNHTKWIFFNPSDPRNN